MRDRVKLSGLLLRSTLSTLSRAKMISDIIVVSNDVRAKRIAKMHAALFLDEGNSVGVNNAVTIANNYSDEAGADATIVVPQDLPLVVSDDIDMVCNYAKEYHKCLVICPSVRYDGSNVLLRKPPKLIESLYENNSFDMHVKAAKKVGAEIKIFLSKRMMRDLDTVQDAEYLAKVRTSCAPIVYLRSKMQ